MNGFLVLLAFIFCIGIIMMFPGVGAPAVLILISSAGIALVAFNLTLEGHDKEFMLQLFAAALFVRVLVATGIYMLRLQAFFGGDSLGYDQLGLWIIEGWQGNAEFENVTERYSSGGWGLGYVVAVVYSLVGRNSLAVQYVNGVIGAATAPLAYLCAQHMFENKRVSRLTAVLVAFFPSLVLWSSQVLKDGPIVFLLVAAMLATLKLSEGLSVKFFAMLVFALFGLLSLRFYVFYMAIAAAGGALLIGVRPPVGPGSVIRQMAIVVALGLSMTYLGVLRTATAQFETYANLERVQRSRSDLASYESGFGRDVDVSTTEGALQAIPLGMVYLLFAPFPWQLANLRQSITLPEMFIWWASFPLLVMGIWFTLKYRMRPALPILIFTTMLTLAYSIFQGNVGTAYRQRSQLLVFYFIFVSVGAVILKERREDRQRKVSMALEEQRRAIREGATRARRAPGAHTASAAEAFVNREPI
ncbi:MAG TPA: glycosyltransferase family 39 protein [Pyrinomonadaceae bacterium]|nr:glycosyltransferase family 39 protein [Pyrinomonadaceae bacterium]